MKSIWLLLAIVAIVNAGTIKVPTSAVVDNEKVRYDNYSVYRLHVKTKAQFSVIQMLQSLTDKYNIWKDYDELSQEVHIMVQPAEIANFVILMKLYGFKTEVMIVDVQKLIDEEQAASSTDDTAFGWTRYYGLAEIEAWLDEILAAHPGVTEGFVIGKSYEGRDIRGIKIAHNADKPVIFIESNIHAREWITSASATWFINELLNSENPISRELALNYVWYIVPVFNVDGFEYSHQRDRMWRKTRQPAANSQCVGADANRNFDSHWLENGGASAEPCSETYAGSAAFSESEAKALANYVTSIKDKIKLYISFHSYGQYLLSPYGHTKEEPDNYADILTIGNAFSSAISGYAYNTQYAVGSTASVLYVASGTSVDWVYNTLGVRIGYTIEFRDKGRFGFVLPPVQIIPNCEELLTGLNALVSKSKELQYL